MESTATQLVKIHDGAVLLRFAGKEYSDTVENYALDAGEDFPTLPEGAIGRSYIPGEKHRTTNGLKAIQLPMPWAEGDALLSRVSALVAAKTLRDDLPGVDPAPINLRASRTAALEALLVRRALDSDASQEEKDYQDAKRTRT